MATEATMTTSQEENLPLFNQLLKNPLRFSLDKAMDLRAVSDANGFEEPRLTGHDHDDHKAVFCGGMMMMSDTEMAQHGVASMQMSKGGMVM
jgi:hypothetical protein